MKHSFGKVISTEDLREYANLMMYAYTNDESFRLNSYQGEKEDYELHLKEEALIEKVERSFKKMNARQWIDVQKWLFSEHKKLIESVNPDFVAYPFYKVARYQIFASKKVKTVCKDSELIALEYTKEEEEEIINWWLGLKWEHRMDYTIMDEIHSAIKLILPTKFDYSRKTDPIEDQSEDRDKFLEHSWELIRQSQP